MTAKWWQNLELWFFWIIVLKQEKSVITFCSHYNKLSKEVILNVMVSIFKLGICKSMHKF